jgi:hypothetical protein
LRQNVDRFADGTLGYSKFQSPFTLDDSHSGGQRAVYDFRAQAFCQIVLYKTVSRQY